MAFQTEDRGFKLQIEPVFFRNSCTKLYLKVTTSCTVKENIVR